MLCVDISHSSCFAADVDKTYFGKFSVKHVSRVSCNEGESWESKIPELLKDQKIAYAIPNSKVFLHRFSIPLNAQGPSLISTVLEKATELIPAPMMSLLYDFIILHKDQSSSSQTVLFIAVALDTLQHQYEVWQKSRVSPVFIVPECIASFEVLKGEIGKGETILYIDVDKKTSTLSFFDNFGPLLTLSEPSETQKLEEETKKALEYFKKNYSMETKKILLGGEGTKNLNVQEFGEKIGLPTMDTSTIFQKILKVLNVSYDKKIPITVEFLNVVGLGILALQNESLNLLKKGASVLSRKKPQTSGIKESFGKTPQKEGEISNGLQESPQSISISESQEELIVEKPKNKRFIILSIVLLILIVANGIAFSLKNSKNKKTQSQKTNIEKQTKEVVPSVISPPTSQKEDFNFQVLNGSGEEGVATVAKDYLASKGYKNISTDNADNFDYTRSILKIKEKYKDLVEVFLSDLKDEYDPIVDTQYLDEGAQYDVILTVGKE